jgi:hypothetical protein
MMMRAAARQLVGDLGNRVFLAHSVLCKKIASAYTLPFVTRCTHGARIKRVLGA